MEILKATSNTKEAGWSFSFETLKAIEKELSERGWPADLEEINEMLEVLNENNLLIIAG